MTQESQHVEKESNAEGRFPIYEDAAWGFIDQNGQIVIEPQFKDVSNFSEGLAAFKSVHDGRWGYVNQNGDIVVEPVFDSASPFFDGRAIVIKGQQGVIDKAGNLVVDPVQKRITKFSRNRAFILVGNNWKLIDDQGDYVTQNSFKQVGTFREGLAPFHGFNNDYSISGYINTDGETEILLEDEISVNIDGLAGFFHQRALVYKHRLNLFDWNFGGPDSARQRAYGLINPQGEIAVKPQYDYIDIQSECLAVVLIGDRYGATDLNGNVLIPLTFSYIGDFSEGLAIAQRRGNGKYGYINSRGKFVIKPMQEIDYSSTSLSNIESPERRNFYNDRALYKNDDGKYGYIDRTGQIVIEPVFEEAFPFEGGVAKFKNSDSWGYLDTSGTIIWQSADIQYSDHSLNHVF